MRAFAGVALLAAWVLPAGALDVKPRVEGEGRYYFQADGERLDGSAAATVEFFHDWDEGQRLAGELFQRYDARDDSRTHGDVRELYYQSSGETFEFRVGARRVYWGVTESRHLVDIVNQTDFVDDIDGKTRLGQPMMDLAWIQDWGTLDFFLLPYPRARTFPGRDGRPRFPLPVAADQAQYESRHGQHRLDSAVRFTGSFGPLDVGIAWFDGTARDPRLAPCLQKGSGFQGTADGPNCDILSGIVLPTSPLPGELVPVLQALGLAPSDEEVAAQIEADVRRNLVLVPFYDRLRQVSVDAQYVIGSLALKVEALHRHQLHEGSWATVTGFEYTFGDVAGSGTDIGVLGEYLYDGMVDPLGRFDDELFFGSRLGFSDTAGTQVLAGALLDRENFRNRGYGIEASRRVFSDDWKLSLESRMFQAIPRRSSAAFLEDQDYVTLVLERFF